MLDKLIPLCTKVSKASKLIDGTGCAGTVYDKGNPNGLVQRTARFALIVVFLVIGVSAPPPLAYAQAGFEDDRVMIQGFYWESSRHGYQQKFPQFGSEHWYAIIAREAPKIRAARLDLIWLPPPSLAGGFSAGYDPREYLAELARLEAEPLAGFDGQAIDIDSAGAAFSGVGASDKPGAVHRFSHTH